MLTLGQGSISIAVDYYNEDEKQALLAYRTGQQIDQMVGTSPIEVPTSEFLTYYLFHRKRPGMKGWRSFNELNQKTGHALSDISWGVRFDKESIISVPESEINGKQDPHLVERIGESVSLSVVNRIHGLTEADWGKIPESSNWRSFDYTYDDVEDKIASDGTHTIQVEAKGTTSLGIKRGARAGRQRRKIRDKKAEIRQQENEEKYPYRASLRYGCVAILGADHGLRAYLVDPEGDDVVRSPEALRIINRMMFLRDWISLVAPRSQLASSLSTRTAALLALEDPTVLDGNTLRKANGEPFNYSGFDHGGAHVSLLWSKAFVLDGPSGGILVQPSPNFLYLLGIMEDLVFLAQNQSFSEILGYAREGGTVRKTVRCQFSDRQLEAFQLPGELRERMTQSGRKHTIDLEGNLMYSPSGLVHGILPLD